MERGIGRLVCLGFALCAATLTACGGGSSSQHGNESGLSNASKHKSGLKVVNGTQIAETDLPSVVRVQTVRYDGEVAQCTGTVIGSNTVLTAGHCLRDGQVVYITIYTGEMFQATTLHYGEGYDSSGVDYADDIGLAVTDQALGVPALPLIAADIVAAGDSIYVAGYGVEDAVVGQYGTLRVGSMYVEQVDADNIFVKYYDSTSNVCHGDSGGPALVIATLEDGVTEIVGVVGVVSTTSDSMCEVGAVTAYTRVTKYADGIKELAPDTIVYY